MATLFREAFGRMAVSTNCIQLSSLRWAGPATRKTASSTAAAETASSLPAIGRRAFSTTPACRARLISRPQRPYQFTQMVQLSDGSTFTVRTTSPYALHRSTKDTRNHILWQPSEKSLRNVEVDEAGRLAAFRNRFGHGWDASQDASAADAAEPENQAKAKSGDAAMAAEAEAGKGGAEDPFDSLADLLSGYAAKEGPAKHGGLSAKEQARKDKKKK